jgi:glycerophosphoryl diester phosphodiesterase
LYNASNFPQLLKGILQEILFKPLNWEKICEICVAEVQAAGSQQCQVVPIGLNNAKNSLVNALKKRGEFNVILDDRSSDGPAISHGASNTVRVNVDIEHPFFTLGTRLCLL